MSVKASRVEGESARPHAPRRWRGRIRPTLIARIEPDEVPYPEPPDEAAAQSDAGTLDAAVSRRQSELALSRYEPIIQRVSAAHGVDPTLVRAVIQVESAYQPQARSVKGAVGLMQVMPATGAPIRDHESARSGSEHRGGHHAPRSLLDRFPLTLALAAYNAGEVAVQRFSGVPPYPETRSYVSRILKLVEP